MKPASTADLPAKPAMNQNRIDTGAPVLEILGWCIALGAAAGGLIHLKAAFDHRDLVVVAIGFAAMGTSQVLFAATMLVHPSRTALVWGGSLHGAILLVWILSRTTGLSFIPGAEMAAPVGVADAVANTFSVAIAGAVVIALAVHRSDDRAALPPRVVGAIRAMVLAGLVILTVPALTETHDHGDDHGSGQSLSTTSHHDAGLGTPAPHVHRDHQHTSP